MDNDVYTILSQIIGLKFKAQFENSGLEFHKIYAQEDIQTGEKSHLIIIDDKVLIFKNNSEFLKKFIRLLKMNLNQLDLDYEEVQKNSTQLSYDENWAFEEHERIVYYGMKQRKLLEKMESFLSSS